MSSRAARNGPRARPGRGPRRPARRSGPVAPRRFRAAVGGRGAREVRCVTSPGNAASIAFHTRLGFRPEPGDPVADGVPVHADHDGPGLHRAVLVRAVTDAGG